MYILYCSLFLITGPSRLSPVVLDSKGIHFQKGIRHYGFVAWEQVYGVEENTKSPKEVDKDRNSIVLALHGLKKSKFHTY